MLMDCMNWSFLHEIRRKIIHLIILVVLILFFAIKSQAGQQTAFLFLISLLLLFLIFEYFRLELNLKLPFFHRLIRPKEEQRIYGVVFFLSSTIITLAVFDTPIALAAL